MGRIHMSVVPVEVWRGYWIPRSWSWCYKVFVMHAGNAPGSSAERAQTLNCQAISPSPSGNVFNLKTLSLKLIIYLFYPFNLALNGSRLFQKGNLFSRENELPTLRAWKYYAFGSVGAFQQWILNSSQAVEANLECRHFSPKDIVCRTHLSLW